MSATRVLRVLLLPLAVLVAMAVAWPAAAAGNGHFIRNATSAGPSVADLVVHFQEAGPAAGSTETITVSATATTTYECVHGGGKNPSASNKTTTSTRVSESGELTADENGSVVGTLPLSPPSAADLGFSCPPGQTTTVVGVTYSNVSVSDADSGASLSLSGRFSYTSAP